MNLSDLRKEKSPFPDLWRWAVLWAATISILSVFVPENPEKFGIFIVGSIILGAAGFLTSGTILRSSPWRLLASLPRNRPLCIGVTAVAIFLFGMYVQTLLFRPQPVEKGLEKASVAESKELDDESGLDWNTNLSISPSGFVTFIAQPRFYLRNKDLKYTYTSSYLKSIGIILNEPTNIHDSSKIAISGPLITFPAGDFKGVYTTTNILDNSFPSGSSSDFIERLFESARYYEGKKDFEAAKTFYGEIIRVSPVPQDIEEARQRIIRISPL